jgi:cytochrome c556
MRLPIVLLTTLATAALFAACHRDVHEAAHDHAAVAPLPSASAGANAMQSEMRLLNEAMRDAVTAIGYDRLDTIAPSLHAVHEAKARTEEALESGAYKLPKHADRLEDFKAQDEAFHGELVKLLGAAKAKDRAGTTRQLGVVLDGCTSCHEKYRF